jgi:phosphoribosylanthranilate isomerase
MKLKVCGMTSFEQLQALEQLGIDFAGLIFYESSKRFVGDKLNASKSEVRSLQIKKVGVFVNAEIDTIKKEVEEYGLSYVQLHGDESAEFCKQVKSFISVIKAIRINEESALEKELKVFEEACDYLLFDTASPSLTLPEGKGTNTQSRLEQEQNSEQGGLVRQQSPSFGGVGEAYGGTGKQFNWERLTQSDIKRPFFLSGGIGLEDLEKVKSFQHEMLYAIDVNSRFETTPGIKNLEQVEVFLKGIKLIEEDTQ